MPRLLSLLTPLLALVGCGKCIPLSLSPDERAWVSAYQPGQQVRFRSNRGSSNTFTARPLVEWHENQNCNVLEAGRYQPIRSTLALTGSTSYGADNGGAVVVAYRTLPDQPMLLTLGVAGLLCQFSEPPGSPNPKQVKLTPEAITLADGRRFPQAQRFRSGEQDVSYSGGSLVRAAWWDQHTGLLRYELASGEVFDLVAE